MSYIYLVSFSEISMVRIHIRMIFLAIYLDLKQHTRDNIFNTEMELSSLKHSYASLVQVKW